MEALKGKLSIILHVVDKFDAYLDKKIPVTDDKKACDRMTESSAKIKELSEIPMSVATIDDGYAALSNISEMWTLIQSIKAETDEISSSSASSMSDTYSRSVSKLYLDLLKNYAIGSAEYAKLRDKFIVDFSTVFVDGTDEKFREMRRAYISHPFTTDLYANMAQKTIDILWKKDRLSAFDVLAQIEEDKNRILRAKYPRKKNKLLIKSNPPIQTFGLMGLGAPVDLSVLLKDIFGASIKTLESKCKKMGVCCVLMQHVTNTPTSFRIMDFIDRKMAAETAHSIEDGISGRLVKKMKTIVKEDDAKWTFKHTVYGSVSANRFVILETINGKTYTPLAPWIKGPHFIPRHNLSGFIESMKGIPTPIEMYTALTQGRDKMFFAKPPKMIINETRIDPKYLRNDINNELLETYNKQKQMKTPAEFEKFIHGETLPNQLSDSLIQYYTEHVKPQKTHKFGYSELVTDFLGELQYITRSFSQEMLDQYIEHAPDPSVYNSKHRADELRRAFEKMLDAVLQSTITDTKNVFQAMMFKDKLLDVAF